MVADAIANAAERHAAVGTVGGAVSSDGDALVASCYGAALRDNCPARVGGEAVGAAADGEAIRPYRCLPAGDKANGVA